MKGKFTFLGTGSSMGVPVIGCKCGVCLSDSPFNKRLRCSGLLNIDGKNFLIDVGPDFREQALRYQIDRIDALLITHTHYDHIGGIDDLRIFHIMERKKIPCLLSQESLFDLGRRFPYMIDSVDESFVSDRFIFSELIGDFGECDFEGVHCNYLTYKQLEMKVTGFRVGKFAYVSDIREYDEDVLTSLRGLDTLILSGVRYLSSQMHFSLEEAALFAQKVGAKKCYLTHISHEIDHGDVECSLPEGISLGFDGQVIELEL